MSDIHNCGGEKGGVGKSTVCKVILQYLIDHKISCTAFDTDRSASDLKKAYSRPGIDIRSAIFSEAAEHENAAKEIFNTALEKTVLVNLAASSFEPVSSWIRNNELLEIAEESGINFYLWFVTDGSVESVGALYKSLQTFGQEISHIVVKNTGRNPSGDWRLIDEDLKLKGLMKSCQVKELIFPKFYGEEEFKIIRDNSLGFREALESQDLGFGPIERQRIRRFLRESYQAIESVKVWREFPKSQTA